MCGIVGYIGTENNAKEVIIEGLKRLEYRGYDSAGIALHKGNVIETRKHVGEISNLKKSLVTMISKVRWVLDTQDGLHTGLHQM